MVKQAGVVVIGAGVIGSAVAWQLAEQGARDVVVLDPDLRVRSSSELNAEACARRGFSR